MCKFGGNGEFIESAYTSQSTSESRSLILFQGMQNEHGLKGVSLMYRVCFRLAQLFINAHTIRVARPCHASAMFCMQGRTEAEVASMPCVAGPGGGRTALSAEACGLVILWLL